MGMWRALAVLVGASLLGPLAQGADTQGALHLHIGVSVLRADFRELADNGQRLVRERGTLPGVVGGAAQTLGHWSWSAELSYYSGALDYDGQTQSGASFETMSDATVAGIRLRALRMLDHEGRFWAGLGLGYGQWQRHIRGRGKVNGLDERFTAADVSAEARLSLLRSQEVQANVDLRLAWPWRPEVRVDFGGLYDTQSLQLGPRLAARVAVPVSFAAGPRSRLVVEPGLDAWAFGRSATETLYRDGVPAGGVYQPQGKGYDLRLKLIWVQSF